TREAVASPFQDRLLALNLTGMLVESDDGLFSPLSSVESVKRRLRKALKDRRVKGILLRIDSPGGTVATSQELYSYLQELKAKNIPLVASMADVAASGGYYVACGCDKIVCQPGTITGSIGVIMNSFNIMALERKLGIEPQVIKSGKYKDIGSPNRQMTAEEKEILENLILDSYDQFIETVASGRKMDKQRVRKLADGRIYSGRQALKLGLVDELGGYEKAVRSLKELAKTRWGLTKDLPLDEGRRSALGALVETLESRISSQVSPLGLLPASMNARFHKLPLWVMQ
ncbi:MAG TPA: signal peptide peptidase SppA, partial [Candidatus Obscuribacterales bacterium]